MVATDASSPALVYPISDAALVEEFRDVIRCLPWLRDRLQGLPVCGAGCQQHTGIYQDFGNGRSYKHIVVRFATGLHDALAVTTFPLSRVGTIEIRVRPAGRVADRTELRNLAAHELLHAGEAIDCFCLPQDFDRDEHCVCFHNWAFMLNNRYGSQIAVFQGVRAMGARTEPCQFCVQNGWGAICHHRTIHRCVAVRVPCELVQLE